MSRSAGIRSKYLTYCTCSCMGAPALQLAPAAMLQSHSTLLHVQCRANVTIVCKSFRKMRVLKQAGVGSNTICAASLKHNENVTLGYAAGGTTRVDFL